MRDSPIERWKLEHSAEVLAQRFGLQPMRDGTLKGPCPICGGNDRFTLWPAEQSRNGDTRGFCRSGCGFSGDGLALVAAADKLGVAEVLRRDLAPTVRARRPSAPPRSAKSNSAHAKPPKTRDTAPTRRPAPTIAPSLLAGLPADVRERVLCDRPEWREAVADWPTIERLLRLLALPPECAAHEVANLSSRWSDAFEAATERAAIMQFDGGLPREQAEQEAVRLVLESLLR